MFPSVYFTTEWSYRGGIKGCLLSQTEYFNLNVWNMYHFDLRSCKYDGHAGSTIVLIETWPDRSIIPKRQYQWHFKYENIFPNLEKSLKWKTQKIYLQRKICRSFLKGTVKECEAMLVKVTYVFRILLGWEKQRKIPVKSSSHFIRLFVINNFKQISKLVTRGGYSPQVTGNAVKINGTVWLQVKLSWKRR